MTTRRSLGFIAAAATTAICCGDALTIAHAQGVPPGATCFLQAGVLLP